MVGRRGHLVSIEPDAFNYISCRGGQKNSREYLRKLAGNRPVMFQQVIKALKVQVELAKKEKDFKLLPGKVEEYDRGLTQ